MKSDLHNRRSIRLPGYDYTQEGAYFITICTHQRVCLFGDIINAEMRLTDEGRIARAEWLRTAELRSNVIMDEFVVMPNHVHGIVLLTDTPGRGTACRALKRDVRDPHPRGTACRALKRDVRDPHPRGTACRALKRDVRDPHPWGTACRAHSSERFGQPVSGSIPTIVRAFKSAATKHINELFRTRGAKIWQRNYYEHIIRNEDEMDRIRDYIAMNPMRWPFDRQNPNAVDIEPESQWRI